MQAGPHKDNFSNFKDLEVGAHAAFICFLFGERIVWSKNNSLTSAMRELKIDLLKYDPALF